MKIEQLLKEAALERPGVGMPLTVMHMSQQGWVPSIDEYLDQDDAAWSVWFLLLYQFLKSKDHLTRDTRSFSRWTRASGSQT